MRNKQKRRQKENEYDDPSEARSASEMYVDKDRAIASSGGDDLKGHILKHRGRLGDGNKALDEFDLAILLQQAEYELKFGHSEVRRLTLL